MHAIAVVDWEEKNLADFGLRRGMREKAAS